MGVDHRVPPPRVHPGQDSEILILERERETSRQRWTFQAVSNVSTQKLSNILLVRLQVLLYSPIWK